MADIACTLRHWKDRGNLYRLSRILLQSINYVISYTVSKRVQIDENMQKSDFRVHLTQRILHV